MGLEEKIKNAKQTHWLTDGFTDEEIEQIIEDARQEIKEFRENQNNILLESKYER